jgi:hypothetical protein
LPLQRAIDKATEELSNSGKEAGVWNDWESITDAPESRRWLQENIVISRGMVHAAAARFAEAFTQVGFAEVLRYKKETVLTVVQKQVSASRPGSKVERSLCCRRFAGPAMQCNDAPKHAVHGLALY